MTTKKSNRFSVAGQDNIFIIPNIRQYNKIKVHFNHILDSETEKKKIDKLEQLSQKSRASQLIIIFNI